MKALVYFDFKEYEKDKNKVVIDRKRLKEIFDEIYNAGYTDGCNRTDISHLWTMPTITTTPEITCGDRTNSIPLNNPGTTIFTGSSSNIESSCKNRR